MAGRIILGFANPALDANGKIDSGSTLTFYANGTTTPQTVYSDQAMLVPLQNPLPCDAAGRFPTAFWGPIGSIYSIKWSLTGASAITVDNVAPTIDGTGSIHLATGSNIQVGGTDGTAQITAQSGTAPSISVYKTGIGEYFFAIDANNFLNVGQTAAPVFIGPDGSICTGADSTHFNSGVQVGVAKTSLPKIGLVKTGIAEYDITIDSNSKFNIGTSLTNGIVLDGGVAFYPATDNSISLGKSAQRWTTVYASTGAINTSDEREKQWRGPLTDVELTAAKQIFAEIGGFKFLWSIADKSDDGARLHIGVRAQKVLDILKSNGLDPFKYAFVCYDEWEATQDAPAGNRYGIRPDELTYFLLAAIDSRLAALENK